MLGGQKSCSSVPESLLERRNSEISKESELRQLRHVHCSQRRWTMVATFYQQNIQQCGAVVWCGVVWCGCCVNFSWFLTTTRGSATFQSLSKYAAAGRLDITPSSYQAHLAKVVRYPSLHQHQHSPPPGNIFLSAHHIQARRLPDCTVLYGILLFQILI